MFHDDVLRFRFTVKFVFLMKNSSLDQFNAEKQLSWFPPKYDPMDINFFLINLIFMDQNTLFMQNIYIYFHQLWIAFLWKPISANNETYPVRNSQNNENFLVTKSLF